MDAFNMAMEAHLNPEGELAPTKEQFIQTVGPTLKKWYSTDVTDMDRLYADEYEVCAKRGFRPFVEALLTCLGFKTGEKDETDLLEDLRTKALGGTNIRKAEDLTAFLAANPWVSCLFPWKPTPTVSRPALVPQPRAAWEDDYEDYHGNYSGPGGRCACGCGEMECGSCIDVCRCWNGRDY